MQAAPSRFYLAGGQAAVLRDGFEVGKLSGGALIGEATALDGAHATGTVVLGSNARLWFVPAAALRAYLAATPAIAGALHEGFARGPRGRAASANTRTGDPPPGSGARPLRSTDAAERKGGGGVERRTSIG